MKNGPVSLYRVVAYDTANPDRPPELIGVPDSFTRFLVKSWPIGPSWSKRPKF